MDDYFLERKYFMNQLLIELDKYKDLLDITKITLKKDKSADGIVYSKAVFACVGILSPEQKARVGGMAEQLKAMTQPEIVNDEYKPQKNADQDMEFAASDEIIDKMEELPPEFVDC